MKTLLLLLFACLSFSTFAEDGRLHWKLDEKGRIKALYFPQGQWVEYEFAENGQTKAKSFHDFQTRDLNEKTFSVDKLDDYQNFHFGVLKEFHEPAFGLPSVETIVKTYFNKTRFPDLTAEALKSIQEEFYYLFAVVTGYVLLSTDQEPIAIDKMFKTATGHGFESLLSTPANIDSSFTSKILDMMYSYFIRRNSTTIIAMHTTHYDPIDITLDLERSDSGEHSSSEGGIFHTFFQQIRVCNPVLATRIKQFATEGRLIKLKPKLDIAEPEGVLFFTFAYLTEPISVYIFAMKNALNWNESNATEYMQSANRGFMGIARREHLYGDIMFDAFEIGEQRYFNFVLFHEWGHTIQDNDKRIPSHFFQRYILETASHLRDKDFVQQLIDEFAENSPARENLSRLSAYFDPDTAESFWDYAGESLYYKAKRLVESSATFFAFDAMAACWPYKNLPKP